MIKIILTETAKDSGTTIKEEGTIEAKNLPREAERKLFKLFEDLILKYPQGIVSYTKKKSKKA